MTQENETTAIKLLIVDDDQRIIRNCLDTLEVYQATTKRSITIESSEKIEDACNKLDNSYDGAIIDLNFGTETDGTYIIKQIRESFFRIPVVILTATSGGYEIPPKTQIFQKDEEAVFNKIFDYFWKLHHIGLSRIIGGKGKIEATLNDVFQNNLLPQLDMWQKYSECPGIKNSAIETALLRYTLQYLLHILDNESETYLPAEVLLSPVPEGIIQTGRIFTYSEKNFVVLTPACDLVIRDNGKPKSSDIILAEIEPFGSSNNFKNLISNFIQNNSKTKKDSIEKHIRNNNEKYYHFIPKTDFFEGGFINFRKTTNVLISDIKEKYTDRKIQISPFFLKDIINRFSFYYSRQGQPDIDTDMYLYTLQQQ